MFFAKIERKDIPLVWPEMLAKLRSRTKVDVLPKSFYERLAYSTPASFNRDFSPLEKTYVLCYLIDLT